MSLLQHSLYRRPYLSAVALMLAAAKTGTRKSLRSPDFVKRRKLLMSMTCAAGSSHPNARKSRARWGPRYRRDDLSYKGGADGMKALRAEALFSI